MFRNPDMKTVPVQVPYDAFNIRVQYDTPTRPETVAEFYQRKKVEERRFINRVRAKYADLRRTPGLRGHYVLDYAHSAWAIAETAVGWGVGAKIDEWQFAHWDENRVLAHQRAEANLDALIKVVLDLQYECSRD